MNQRTNPSLQLLLHADETPWAALAAAARAGLPVPNGFVVFPQTSEGEIRGAYEDMKIREKTHFVAVRGPSHGLLNVIGPDTLVHTLRRLWKESPDAPVLIQRMIHAMWCGKAERHQNTFRVQANEGMLTLDPDTYFLDESTGECVRKTIEPKQRKMIRHVDGSSKIVQREGERTTLPAEQLANIAGLARKVDHDISWTIDDRDQIWLIGING